MTTERAETPWMTQLLTKYNNAEAHTFILHLNVQDYVVLGRTLPEYLVNRFARQDLVIFYDITQGITFPMDTMTLRPEGMISQEQLAKRLLGGTAPPDDNRDMMAALAAMGGVPGTKTDALPRAPADALPILERLLSFAGNHPIRSEERRKRGETAGQPDPVRVTVVIDYAESLVPAADWATMRDADRAAVVTLQRWALDKRIGDNNSMALLVTRNLADLHPAIRSASAKCEPIEIPLPSQEQRLAYIKRLYREMDEMQNPPTWNLTPERLANATAGLGLVHIEDIAFRAKSTGALTDDLVRDRKRDIISSEFGDLLEIVEPRFGWERIGGLDHIKTFFQRSVITPIKTGNTTRCPQGVLLIGPPGTGKSAVAEALAYEAGINFVFLRMGKILGSYVGQSLAGEEELILFPDNGLAKRMTIAHAVAEQLPGCTTTTVTDTGETALRSVPRYIEHPARLTILRVTTRTGREIRVTHDHSLFMRQEDRLVEIPGRDLRAGMRVAIPCGWSVPGRDTVNLLDLIAAHADETQWMVRQAETIYRPEELLTAAGVSRAGYAKTKGYYYQAMGRLPLHLALTLPGGGERLRQCTLARRSGNTTYPASFTITPDIAFLAGLWLADGSLNNGGLRVSVHRDEWPSLKERLGAIPFTVHDDRGSQGQSIFLSDWALARILRMLGCTGCGEHKRVPAWVFGTSDAVASAYLSGYFSGDGSFSGHVLEASTISRALAGDLLLLLARFGIIAAVDRRTGTTNLPRGQQATM
ncbi:MAG TPA: LAGLIDADG family homing endonuclease, partial [Chloroflexota bacterium]|nr:LAGLIDADG family homing endonuclease [Chloroflexota bacterium]